MIYDSDINDIEQDITDGSNELKLSKKIYIVAKGKGKSHWERGLSFLDAAIIKLEANERWAKRFNIVN